MQRFLSHLYRLTSGKVELTATTDIKNIKGYSIVKKGGVITPEIYQDIRSSSIFQTLSESVCFTNLMTGEDIYEKLSAMVEKDSSLHDIDKLSQWDVLRDCCESAMSYSPFQEVLTAFAIEMPQLFEQSLTSAYLAFICTLNAEKSTQEVECAFLAGLLHDVGLLFISRKVRNKVDRLSGNEWRQMQLHPIIAYKMLKMVSGFPRVSLKAILEHHENMDGTGYPLGKNGANLSELGLLISLLDDIVAIYRKKFKPLNRTLNDMYPIIQMNTHAYPKSVLSMVLQVLRTVSPSSDKDIDINTLRDLIEYTYQQQLYINKLMDIAGQIHRTVDIDHGLKEVDNLQNDYMNLSVVMTSSGLQESSYVEWLQKLNTDEWSGMYNEIEHTRLMLEEVTYRINSFYNAVSAYVSRYNNEITEQYKLFVHIYSITEAPSIPSSLENYWHR